MLISFTGCFCFVVDSLLTLLFLADIFPMSSSVHVCSMITSSVFGITARYNGIVGI